ncbi:DNA methyltransferase [uncultured Aquimarina sp.]|uniref:Eco57I restriction-modification methylase domain-containing protein n=1 Tax=uncultured Aquimarina sp. TaxID=575652 RepID=UPI00262A204C|nr:DNA methyltransferase [uncultured Aquimarina sp.]
MALYQISVLKKYLKQQDNEAINKAYKKYVKYFLNITIQDNIRSSKEEQFQATFLTELFVNILGYTLNPKPNFNLTTEFKNQKNAGKADGAILNNDGAIGVIELKGTKTKDLESIRKQAFDYKANQKGCVYVITSNFEKLRFYINDATEFEEFDLFELTEEDFQLLYLCLYKENVLTNVPLTIKEASIVEEENITKNFYNDYSVFKRELYRDLVKQNGTRLKTEAREELKKELTTDDAQKSELELIEKNVKLSLFKKSQKLIDRFLFVFFAEDRGLLPPNSTVQIINKWRADLDFGDDRPLYDLFKQYFNFLDIGRQGTTSREEIYAYNGGLFRPDGILDSLIIDNELLHKYTFQLANYNFESQVDVNILGHIFENSLNEIESINAEIEGGDFDKQKSKRKKDGVFYTPKYITKYIVENTVGKLCDKKKAELDFKEEEYFKGRKNRNKKTLTKLVQLLDDYRAWLLQITICDPACGSGAFLNQALDFLIKEHRYIDELKAKILGGGIVFSDIENTILENNIYGVDLNEESVEIAKLSLWLRTAQPRRKLNDLSSNIKCGNSLIESKSVAGHKAFHWQSSFAKVFDNGGFDVIIGNPPYLNMTINNTNNIWLKYYTNEFKSVINANSKNIYTLFNEMSCHLVKENGIVSFIIPEGFLKTRSYNDCVIEMEKHGKIYSAVYFEDWVFDDATTGSMIFDFVKSLDKRIPFKEYFMNKNKVVSEIIPVVNPVLIKYEKLDFKTIDDYCDLFKGMAVKNRKEFISEIECELPNVFLLGNCIDRYTITNKFYCDYNKLTIVGGTKKLEKHNIAPRILIRRTGNYLCCVMLEKIALTESTLYSCSLKSNDLNIFYLLALFNSKMLTYIVRQKMITNEQAFPQIMMTDIKLLKIPYVNLESQLYLANKSKDLSDLQQKHHTYKTNFIFYIKSSLSFTKTSKKLQNWHLLDFSNFIKELNKAIKANNKILVSENKEVIATLTKKDEFEWLELFEENKMKAQDLQNQINQTEKEIDVMVYELYGLTQEEIEIVENS